VQLADPTHADSLTRDNAAPFVIRSGSQIRVLVQDMQPSVDPARSESHYLMTALAPSGVKETFAPELREGSSLHGANLRDYGSVIITGLARLSPEDIQALSEYVRAGGGLLIFPGDGTNARAVNAGLGAAGLLPARITGRKDLSLDAAVTLNPATIHGHPALVQFRDSNNLELSPARFTRYETLEPVSDPNDPNAVQVLIRYSDDDPAFVERRFGLGHVIQAASGAGATWNQLPLHAAYLPLMYQLVLYLGAGPNAHRNLRQNEPLFLSLPLSDANKPVRVRKPDGKTVTQNSQLGRDGVTFRFTDTGEAGLYHVTVAGSRTRDAFAVSLPSDESDLSTPSNLSQTITEAGLSANRLSLARTPAQLRALVQQSRYGAELWRPLILLAIVLLFMESLLAQLFGRRG
jgi:hypothetical protein